MFSEKFNLCWNKFESFAAQTFRDLYLDQTFADVTLATDDCKQIQAHKNILSSVSPFFKRILVDNPHQHPLLYLKGVKYNQLQAILKFVYLGQVEIPQEFLSDFVSTAKDLEIKGLSEEDTIKDIADNKSSKINDDVEMLIEEKPNLQTIEEFALLNENLEHKEVIMNEENFLVANNVIETNFIGDRYSCENCEYETLDQSNFRRHIKMHTGVRYPCEQCEYKATQMSNLKRHTKNCHN